MFMIVTYTDSTPRHGALYSRLLLSNPSADPYGEDCSQRVQCCRITSNFPKHLLFICSVIQLNPQNIQAEHVYVAATPQLRAIEDEHRNW